MNEQTARGIVTARSLDTCEGCGQPRAGTFAHRLRRSQGGPWTPSNGLRLCGSGTTGCHGWSGANPLTARQIGWELLAGSDPSESPALIRPVTLWLAWWHLDDTGTYTWHRDPEPHEALLLPLSNVTTRAVSGR